MKKHMIVAGAALLALGFTVSTASAATDCSAVEPGKHPVAAKSLVSSLVQAYVSCGNAGGNSPNGSVGSVPACIPPESFHEAASQPTGGWLWGPKGKGKVKFVASGNKVININDQPGAITADLKVILDMAGILAEDLGVADGQNGELKTAARATLNDATNPGTVIDFPANFPITSLGGKIKLVTTANTLLLNSSLPSLAACSTIEVVSVGVFDANQNNFAVMGAYIK